ncbi:MAG: type VI secretion system tip protein TssI/VgrG [Polyangiaceae bacterium]
MVSFEGHEKLSTPYVYDVVFASAVAVEALQVGLFGFPACLSIQSASHEPRVIQGLAVGFEAIGAAESELKTKTRRYMTRIVPRLWLLNHNRKYRVFQDKTAIQIACAVLEEAGITPTIRLQRDEYPPIPFTYQRGETDLEFLHHVLAIAGVFYYFEHASGLLDELVPGGGELGALAGGLGGMAAGAASLGGGFSVGAGSASLGGGLSGGLGGGLANAMGAATSAVGAMASAVGAATTLVLCDRSRHTHALQDASLAASAGGTAAAGIRGLGATLGGALGSLTSALSSAVEEVSEGLGDAIPYDGNGQAATATERIFSFRARTEVRPKKVTLRDWSLPESKGVRTVETSAAATLDVSAGISAALDLAGHGSLSGGLTADLSVDAIPIAMKDASVMEYQRDPALLGAQDAFAEHALSQLRSDRIAAHGESDCRRLAPGYRFTLARHPIAPVNTEYVVTEVRSTGYAPDHLPAERPYLYRSTFDCVPAFVDPRPPKPAPRPPLGLEAAVVVGPVYGDVHCDTIGRIQVRFRWAESSATYSSEADGTCWVHWLERWAGNGFGTMTFPRVGTEVLVDFLQSEGGRPIAIGQLYSREAAAPFSLPSGATRVGIRSQAIPPATGYSEIAIEDANGLQSVQLRAQGRFDVEVTADHARTISGDSTEKVGGALRATIGVERIETVSSSAVTNVGKDSLTRIQGLGRLEVGGAYQVATAGDETRTTGGVLQARVGKTATLLYAADTRRVVGHPDREASSSEFIYGDATMRATKAVTIESETAIVLRCGGTTFEIHPDGVKFGGKTFTLGATSKVDIHAPNASLTLDNDVALGGKAVSLTSSGAALSLDSTAKLTGSKVSLGSGSGKGSSASSSSSNADNVVKPVFIRMRILRSGKPASSVAYTLTLDGGLELNGATDPDGNLEEMVPSTIATANLVFSDTGEVRRLVISQLPPVETVLGAQLRLQRLGLYHGAIDGGNGSLTRHALEVFQRARGLPPSGQLDLDTEGALTKAYGS